MAARRLTATYRLQVHKDFTLQDARRIVPYLNRLGISHVYSSPILAARPGSNHGYDVADPSTVSAEIGGESARRALVETLHEHGLGFVLDIVPNHMGTGPSNPYWEDVLAHGQASRYARWFDIDWSDPDPELHGRVMLPVLGDDLDAVLKRGELSLVKQGDAYRVQYFENSFPLDPETIRDLPEGRLDSWSSDERGRERLRALLDRQHYALTNWREAAARIDYRRFFDINELVAVRAEDPDVFRETHGRILEWVGDGSLDALRIDHIDGLLDPLEYLERLREAVHERTGSSTNPEESAAQPRLDGVHVFVEKILSPGERLRESWPVQGTTGYEFLNDLEAIFLEPEGYALIETAYRELLPGDQRSVPFAQLARACKRLILEHSLASDVRRLVRLLASAEGEGDAAERERAVVALLASLPVYRTYIDGRTPAPAEEDLELIDRAAARAREEGAATEDDVTRVAAVLRQGASGGADALRFIQRFQQTSGPATAKGIEDTALYRFVPLASRNEVGGDPERPLENATGLLHRANAERRERWPYALLCTNTHDTKRSADVRARLDVLTEIPRDWERSVARWRRMNAGLRRRAGSGVYPDPATEYLLYQTMLGVWPLPRPGAPPEQLPGGRRLEELRERVERYMEKAVREAKVHTRWTDPDAEYEEALREFVSGAFDSGHALNFLTDLARFVARVALPGLWTALSRVLVHLTVPGTPDIYQGDELWKFALVDPDNRRPVDYERRTRLLEELDDRAGEGDALIAEMLRTPADGRVKLHVTSGALRLRRERANLFASGGYVPLEAEGAAARHVFAFARTGEGGELAITVVPRLVLTLTRSGDPPVGDPVWGATTLRLPKGLDTGPLMNVFTGAPVQAEAAGGGVVLRMGEILAALPVALLVSQAS